MTEKIQKYHRGDMVKINKEFDGIKSKFSNKDAIVLYSYKDEYGGYDVGSYGLHIKDYGFSAWYYEQDLDLISSNRIDILDEWEKKLSNEIEEQSSLDWVFSNGQRVSKLNWGCSVDSLAKCLGINDLCPSGEGMEHYENSQEILRIAYPFLMIGDKDGYLAFCEKYKSARDRK